MRPWKRKEPREKDGCHVIGCRKHVQADQLVYGVTWTPLMRCDWLSCMWMCRGINMGDGWETARKLTRPAILEAGEGGLIKVRKLRSKLTKVVGNLDQNFGTRTQAKVGPENLGPIS